MPNIIYLTPDCDYVPIFEHFYYKWNKRFFRTIIKDVPHHDFDLTREICQQVWTEIWQGMVAKTLKYLSPSLLVYRADSRIKDHYRRTAKLRQFDPVVHERGYSLNVDDLLDYRAALAAVPEEDRKVFELFFQDGFTQEQIAEQLDISLRTVRRKVDAGLKHLRNSFRRPNCGSESPDC